MNKTALIIMLGAGVGLAASCVESSFALDPDHCNSNDGDDFCGREYADGSRPFCRLGTEVCMELGSITDVEHDGCVAERPEDACYSACGGGRAIEDDPDCMTVADGSETDGGSGSGDADTTADTTAGVDATDGMDATDDTADTSADATDDATTTGPECTDATDCGGTTPFCDPDGVCVACDAMPDPDAACTEGDAALPVCEAGECVQCTESSAAACAGQTPICGADNTCGPCVEHLQCPDSACHLDGADVGGCFDEADVVMVANVGQLNTALAGLGANDQAVLVLAAGTYGQTIAVGGGAEVAILGEGSPTLAGNGSRAVDAFSSAIVYLSAVQVVNGSGDGLTCSGTSVWLDDSVVRNNAQLGLDISGGCAAHLRRTVVRANAGGGIDASGAEVYLVSTSVSGNGGMFSTLGGLALGDTDFEATYSTIAGNDAQMSSRVSLYCTGATSGTVRNSIVVGSGSSVDGCGGLTFNNNGVDEIGLGATNDNVGALDPGWFVNPAAGDFHLTVTGDTVFADIAQWQDDDPLTDIDGDEIPTAMPSHPGYDQP